MAHQQPIRKGLSGSRSGSAAGPRPPGGSAPVEIPDKLYFRIGEVARLCDVPAYVLRFWETEFPQLKPNKGGTGQRLFRRRDVETARRIKRLLYDEGYTIPGARQLLKAEGKVREPQLTLLGDDPRARDRDTRLRELRHGLEDLLAMLKTSPPPASRPRSPQPITQRLARGAAPVLPGHPANVATLPHPDRLFDFPGPARTSSPEETQD